jgi:hypothetical protein
VDTGEYMYNMNGDEREGNKGDIHEEIKNSISHELFQVLVRLPLLGCSVHPNSILQGWNESKNENCNTKNKSWD